MIKQVLLLIVVSLGTVSQAVHAHSEHDKARFVATNGTDSGRCDNRFRPCQTIAYAAQMAGKGDKVLVASGHYSIESRNDLFYLISEIVPVKGGFSRVDHFQIQNPSLHTTTLYGVPPAFADELHRQGFQVIADGKQEDAGELTKFASTAMALMSESHTAAACENGTSAGFSCTNLSLLAHMPLSELGLNATSANDIWGHVDLNTGNEYAIIGQRNGVAVVNVTNPESPQLVGSLPGQSTTWRDIKVYQYYHSASRTWRAYAYVTADSASEGLWIIDLNDLPNGISEAGRLNEDAKAHNIYISNVDYTLNTALPGTDAQIHITGSENYGGAWRSYSLKSLQKPKATYIPESTTRNDYTHDASSLRVTDARATNDCVNGTADGCLVMLDFNELSVRLWDHTNPTSAKELSAVTYPNIQYTHSGWWTEDTRYVIVHDELDESYEGVNTTVHVIDITSLTNPQLVASWVGETTAIDHNGFVRGDRYYMSNYEKGLTVLDISDPTAPTEIANFDTFPSSDNTAFNGAWGVYPFLPSGNLLVSDIQGGLFILKDETVAMESNVVQFANRQISTSDNTTLTVTLSRTGSDAMTVQYATLFGSATATDLTPVEGSVSWSQGDTEDKTLSLTIAENGADEPSELFFLRLFNPNGGSIAPGKGMTKVTIDGEDTSAGVISFTNDGVVALETDATVALTVSRQGGSTGPITVNYALRSDTATVGSDVTDSSGELSWADGDNADKTLELALVNDSDEESEETFFVDLTGASADNLGEFITVAVRIKDDEANQAPEVNAGNDKSANLSATVTLTGSASDPEGNLAETLWTQTSGPTVTLDSPTSLETSFVAPDDAQPLTFSLTATDEFGVQSSDSVTVNVQPAASIPVEAPPREESGGGSLGYGLLLGLGMMSLFRRRTLQTKNAWQ
ncbi:choice-of-anchor B family protein [Alteromonas sp. ASW11-19]|uniref:Choice-of-anchor B family protein n=1 Tax=Alteromonas salexigens TaxID=2982530 RepID=A0ABT2VRI8_9ALTE|nr:choice-of-anchor B family protein [Alteromonas salexigens]MCU7554831.1 choice-of-anchor B family protein [Alteromonas salexigens]